MQQRHTGKTHSWLITHFINRLIRQISLAALSDAFLLVRIDRSSTAKTSQEAATQEKRSAKMRFLHLIRPVMCVLPEVASPDRKVSLMLGFFRSLPPSVLKCLAFHVPSADGCVGGYFVDFLPSLVRRKCIIYTRACNSRNRLSHLSPSVPGPGDLTYIDKHVSARYVLLFFLLADAVFCHWAWGNENEPIALTCLSAVKLACLGMDGNERMCKTNICRNRNRSRSARRSFGRPSRCSSSWCAARSPSTASRAPSPPTHSTGCVSFWPRTAAPSWSSASVLLSRPASSCSFWPVRASLR